MAGVLKEIFTDIILESFYPEGSWLKELTNMDHMVDNNTINLAQVGADPAVVKDNNTWPLTPTQRSDGDIILPLATFDTEPTHVTNVEELETAYDKCKSVVAQHTKALYNKAALSAAYNIAPQEHTADTPVLIGSGTDGAVIYNDLLRLRTAFNKLNLPLEGRILVLAPDHEESLLREDADRYNQIMTTGHVAGFKVYSFNGTPTYTTAGNKQAPTVQSPANVSSFAFHNGEAMRAMGTITGEPEKRWADYRGWLLGFQMRFVALPFRAKGIGAIYSGSTT